MNSFKEQRRFTRVLIKPGLTELIVSLGAEVVWSNLEVSEILDLSYRGVAVRRPGIFPIAVANVIDVELRLGTLRPFTASARVAWCNLDWVGLELNQLGGDGHQAMSNYLDYKLIGTELKPVERVFFSPGDSFTRWFQTPGGVHVFIWENALGQIERCQIDLNRDDLEYDTLGLERGRRLRGNPSRQLQLALLVLSQMSLPEMEDFLRSLGIPPSKA